jgi:DNA-binding transcriptional MerR regulator
LKNKRPTRDTSRQQTAQNAPFDAAAAAKERNLAQITVLDNDWYDRTETQNALNLGERQLRLWVQMGRIRTKTNPANTRQRLYKAEDVEKLRQEAPTKAARSEAAENVPVRAVRVPKAEKQELRALDMVSIVGNLVAGHKAELEMLTAQFAKSLETVVGMILNNQKAEADANRERLKAEREDNRERWELDRQDRLDRRKAARAASTKAQAKPVVGKARRAHA